MELKITNLVKEYQEVMALDHFSITLHNGIYGILGPNGAGKSTLMNILSLLIEKTLGTITLDGTDISKLGTSYLKRIGYMPQAPSLYEDFTFEQCLYYIAALKGLKRQGLKEEVRAIAKKVELEDVLKKKVKTFSGGMKQRAMFAQTLLGDPSILILDEPTAGLDPQKRIELRNLIARLSKDKIVIIATHVVSDVEFIANKIVLLSHGTCIAQGTPQELTKGLVGKVRMLAIAEDELDQVNQKYLVSNLHYQDNQLMARIIDREGDGLDRKSVV